MFLSSVFVLSSVSPGRRRLTLASTRSEPFSMSHSETPSATIVSRRKAAKRDACSGVRRSGRVTISMSGVPQRLKSTTAPCEPARRPPPPPSCTVLAASSSRCTRSKPITSSPSAVGTASRPPLQSGSSYWLIWYALGESG